MKKKIALIIFRNWVKKASAALYRNIIPIFQ